MSDNNISLTPEAYKQFTSAVEQTTRKTLQENPRLTGAIFVVLFFLLQGAMEINDSGADTVAGP